MFLKLGDLSLTKCMPTVTTSVCSDAFMLHDLLQGDEAGVPGDCRRVLRVHGQLPRRRFGRNRDIQLVLHVATRHQTHHVPPCTSHVVGVRAGLRSSVLSVAPITEWLASTQVNPDLVNMAERYLYGRARAPWSTALTAMICRAPIFPKKPRTSSNGTVSPKAASRRSGLA